MPLLARGLVPRRPSSPGELLMIISLVGIVMAGSGTIRYSAWMEEAPIELMLGSLWRRYYTVDGPRRCNPKGNRS